ncbi:MAG: NAD(+) synthase, partial [Malacoplasma sp.]|nr:NAD(+) synthase [Malacoplasma sp.]MDE6893904.1 NAD(+) synthase [Malacoplasma sp.]
MKKDYIKIINTITDWINKVIEESKTKGFVFGVSGGIDSALICAIASKFFKERSLALRLDIYNSAKDISDANLVINHFKVNSVNKNLEQTFNTIIKDLPENKLALMNLKSRLRMVTLYYYAQVYNYLVCGTSNADEIYTGYFTKFGDSGSDFIPLANLTKNDVRECAKLLGVPNQIIFKDPSAGLFENQKDEDDLKVTYQAIDTFLEKKEISTSDFERIEYLHKISEHKRNLPKTILKFGEIIK